MPPTVCVICEKPAETIASRGKYPGWCKSCRWAQTPSGMKRRSSAAPDPATVSALKSYLAQRRKRIAALQAQR